MTPGRPRPTTARSRRALRARARRRPSVACSAATERDPAVMLLGARSTKNAERGGLLALGGRLRVRGYRCRGDMGGIAGMFSYGRVENGARVGIALAAKLVELRHVLLEQAALGLGCDVSFHDGDDVVPQFLARDVA